MEEKKSYSEVEAELLADTLTEMYKNRDERISNYHSTLFEYDSMLFKTAAKLFEYLIKITQIQQDRIKNLENRIAILEKKNGNNKN